jgi:2-polyprenyl-3-methyl-5-hydroxy-6-metoxy-1,4-benzoquinol methylase
MGHLKPLLESRPKGRTVNDIQRYNYAFDPNGQDWAARILRRVKLQGPVLELGPGPGAMTKILIGRGLQVAAIESDSAAVRLLQELGVEVLSHDLNQSEWSSHLAHRQFETILVCDVLEHLLQPERVLQLLTKHAAPNSRLLISVPNIAYAGILASLRAGQFNYQDKGQLDRTHLRFFTRQSIQSMLIASGWIPIAFESNRVPINQSEFCWHWNNLSVSARNAIIEGWDEFDTYQWMVEAVPAGPTGWQTVSQVELAERNEQNQQLHLQLSALQLVHQQERASLLEHQKAFAEAKHTISQLQQQLQLQHTTLVDAQSAITSLQAQLHESNLSQSTIRRFYRAIKNRLGKPRIPSSKD